MIVTPKKTFSFILSLVVISLSTLAWFERQAIYDWYRLRGYNPPGIVQKLARDTTMNDYSRKVFYVNRPSVENRTQFNQHCPKTERTIVLGCYISNRGIYIYDVKDARLQGIEQVTAAHELLHAAYDRLGEDEKNNVIGWLKKAYADVKTPRIRKNIISYQKAGTDVNDELHSILGTEVRDLTPELEDYYKKYFKNRAKIIAYSEKYEKIFTDLQNQAKQLESRLNTLKQTINGLEAQLSAERASLQNQRGQVKTQAQADAFNQRVNKYNDSVSYLNQLVAEYNELVRQYQQLAVQQKELYKAIDSGATSL